MTTHCTADFGSPSRLAFTRGPFTKFDCRMSSAFWSHAPICFTDSPSRTQHDKDCHRYTQLFHIRDCAHRDRMLKPVQGNSVEQERIRCKCLAVIVDSILPNHESFHLHGLYIFMLILTGCTTVSVSTGVCFFTGFCCEANGTYSSIQTWHKTRLVSRVVKLHVTKQKFVVYVSML